MSYQLSALMIVVYWVYVTTFLVMGAYVWYRVERTSRLGMVAPLFSLIMFAFTHALADAMPLIAHYRPEVTVEATEFVLVSNILEAVSFVFLLIFGVASFAEGTVKTRAVYVIGLLGMLGVIVGVVLTSGDDPGQLELAVHAFIGVPAGILATSALARAAYRCHILGVRHGRNGAIIAAAGMSLYTVFALVQPAVLPGLTRMAGVPVQTHRAFAAIVVTVGVGWMLERLSVRTSGQP